jgi:hypothetical protein
MPNQLLSAPSNLVSELKFQFCVDSLPADFHYLGLEEDYSAGGVRGAHRRGMTFHFLSFPFISFHFLSFHFISFHFLSFSSTADLKKINQRAACAVLIGEV